MDLNPAKVSEYFSLSTSRWLTHDELMKLQSSYHYLKISILSETNSRLTLEAWTTHLRMDAHIAFKQGVKCQTGSPRRLWKELSGGYFEASRHSLRVLTVVTHLYRSN